MMRLVIVSDTHNILKGPVPSGDVLIHCGDATMWGKLEEVKEFAEWFNGLDCKEKIFVPGNHDFLFEKDLAACKQLLHGHVLVDQEIQLEGKRFYGTPWVPNLPAWAFYGNSEKLKHKFGLIPEDVDVLITHGPPRGILDHMGEGSHVGSSELLEAIERKQPALHCFGHIHEDGGIMTIKRFRGYTAVNAAVCNEFYKLSRMPFVIDI